MNWIKKLLPLGVALMALGARADADALVRSAAVSIDLDTRLTARTVASAADILPISCSLVNAGASSGIAQLSVEGAQNAVLTLSTGLLFPWVPTEPGVYTLKHQIVGASTPALTATFVVPSRSAAVTLDLDTHTGVRQIAQGDAASVLPFAYSGSNWGDERGTATVTGKRDGVALSTQIGPSDKTSVYDWGFYSEPGRYVFTHASTAPGANDLTAEFEVVPHPDNDYFSEAIDLGRTTSGTATGDSTWATLENGEPICATFTRAVKTVWWKWTSPGDGSVTLNTFGSGFDTVLAVYRGAALNALTRVAYNDDASGERQSEVEFAVAADTTYYVCVGGYGGSSDGEAGIVRLAWSSTMMPNDFYSGAERLPSSLAGQATGGNAYATPEYDDPIRKTYSTASNTVWWAWTAPGWGVMRFDTAGSAFDTVLGVYTNRYDYGAHVVDAGSIRYLMKVAENDDYNQTRQSQVEFACTAGMTYYICVAGYNAATAKGAITLNWIPSDGMDPGNDDFADAFEISGMSGTGYGNNEYATSETGENSSYPYSERSVWWAWTAERTGRVEFSTKGSDFDTVLEAYTGYAVNALTRIAANDDEDPSDYVNTSRIEFDCTGGKTYYLRVAGYGSPNRGAIELGWSYLSAVPVPVPKAVLEDGGKTLRFVYDGVAYGTEGRNWFDVSTAESLLQSEYPPWYSTKITKAVFDASFADYAPTGMAYWFRGLGELAEIEGIENLDASRVASTAGLFLDCVKLKSVDLHRLNLVQVTNARAMFSGCLQLRTVYVGIDQVFAPNASTDMFKNCFRLVGENGTVCNGVSRTDATYARRDLPGEPGYFSLFREAYAVWDAQTATLNFRFDENFSELNPVFRRWDDVVSAETEWINWSNWRQAELCTACTRVVFEPSMSDFKPTSCRCLFSSLSAVTEVSGLKWLDTHAVTDMSRMFETCNALVDVPFEGLDTSSVTNMSSMFAYCNHLERLDIGSFDTSRVEDMSYMFSGCTRLAEIDATYLFTVGTVTKSTDMFAGCTALVGGKGTAYDSANVDKSRANVDENPHRYGYFTAASLPYAVLGGMSGQRVVSFRYDDKYGNNPVRLTNGFCIKESAAVRWPVERICEVAFEPSITNWHPTSCERLFWNLSQVSNITGLAYLDTSLCTNMTSMFSGMKAMKSLDVTALDTSRVRNMSHMFDSSWAATNVVLRGLDTSSVTDMNRMFMECYALKSVDFSGVSTRSVDNMSSMFYSCSKLETLDLSDFDTSCVTNMSAMFSSCGSLATIYVSEDFVTDRVRNSSSMFYNCTKLVGGAGTAFDSDFVTATRACVDNPPDSPGYFTSVSSVLNGYAAWVAEKGLRGADAAWDAKPALWGGKWENGFVYTYGEGLADGTLAIMNISFDVNGKPVITTTPVVEGHTDFIFQVIGTETLDDWSSPVFLNRNGNDWTLPVGTSAHFFRVRLSE